MNATKLKKAEQWATTVTDGLGKPIDAGILRTVAALHALGINTSGSCEGHQKWGIGGPYIDTESVAGGKLRDTIFTYRKKHKFKKRLTLKLEALAEQARKENLKHAVKVLALLEEFYKNRNTTYENRIIMSFWSYDVVRLECQGSEINEGRKGATKLRALRAYQNEFRFFEKFLIAKK
jgi:hypothetical protein